MLRLAALACHTWWQNDEELLCTAAALRTSMAMPPIVTAVALVHIRTAMPSSAIGNPAWNVNLEGSLPATLVNALLAPSQFMKTIASGGPL